MFSQLIKQCIQSLPYRINSVKINVRCLCQIPTKEQQTLKEDTKVKDKKIPETRYPGYEIIYKYPFIRYISLYNITKRNMLFCSSILIPTMFALSEMNIISHEFGITASACACILTLSQYIFGVLCDNQIGIIYYKDEKNIKIAYVDIWGKRVDIDTSLEDIKPLEENPRKIADKFYKTIHLASLKFPLKLIVANSMVSNKDRLISILGDYD